MGKVYGGTQVCRDFVTDFILGTELPNCSLGVCPVLVSNVHAWLIYLIRMVLAWLENYCEYLLLFFLFDFCIWYWSPFQGQPTWSYENMTKISSKYVLPLKKGRPLCNTRGRTNQNKTHTSRWTKNSGITFGVEWCADILNSTELDAETVHDLKYFNINPECSRIEMKWNQPNRWVRRFSRFELNNNRSWHYTLTIGNWLRYNIMKHAII